MCPYLAARPLALLLSACGGGGGGVTSTFGQPDPTPTPIFAPSITDSGTLSGFSYGLWNQPVAGGARNLTADILGRNSIFSSNKTFEYPRKSLDVTYSDNNGFKGIYSYKGQTGQITSDVVIEATFSSFISIDPYLTGYIGKNTDIVMEGDNFGEIRFSDFDIHNNGKFRDDEIYFSDGFNGSGTLTGAFSRDGSSSNHPHYIAGEVKMKRFSKSFLDDSRSDNSLVGVFVAEKD